MGAQASAQRFNDREINQQQQDYQIKIPSQQMQNEDHQQILEVQYLNQIYLKNQPFQKQKQYILRALVLFLIRLIILLIVFNIFTTNFFVFQIYPNLSFELFGTIYIVLIILSRFPIFQNTPISYAIFIITLLLEPFLLLYSYFHFIIISIIRIQIRFQHKLLYSVYAIFMWLFLYYQSNSALIYNAIASFFIGIFVYAYNDLSINITSIVILLSSFFLMTISGLLITLVTKQMFEGRFSVKINQIFGIVNVYQFGLYFPCNF
ncbi:unnamed protein product [Paramecium sonneborni]|uniref:Transmembrane protein n=1 Tax=Paramecium sonneborni TaxID=65129 RepID=A0A8S1QY82_9CILI|nr:unnamed protein product [Paramecium sonneborni]